MTRFIFTTSIERGDDEIDVRVVYDVSPFVDATYWQPAEGSEVEIIEVMFVGVDQALTPSSLTDAEEAHIQREAEERAPCDLEDKYAAVADQKYQEYRDRLLMAEFEGDEE